MSERHEHDELVRSKLIQILHDALVEVRQIGLQTGNEKLADLGDTFEIIPQMMARWDDESLKFIRRVLAEYQSKHGGRDYTTTLDMDDDRYRELFVGPWTWPEPSETNEAVAPVRRG